MKVATFLIENSGADDFNLLPPQHERCGVFYQWLAPVLGIEPERYQRPGERDFEYDAVVRRDARIAAANAPPTPLQAIVGDAVDAVVEVAAKVAKVTKIDKAKAWLLEKLGNDGAIAQRDVEEQGALAGHTLKNLQIGKRRLGVKSFKKAGKWWWTLKPMGEGGRG